MPVGTQSEASVGDLFGRLAEDGKAYVRAEAELYKAIARRRASKAGGGAAALVAAVFLLNAALITLTVFLALALTLLVGPLLAGLIVFFVVSAIAAGLAWWGLGKVKAIGGDEEERKALKAGEMPR
ncbi:MAG: phage holin family protein [Allosphingosinicella sp.]